MGKRLNKVFLAINKATRSKNTSILFLLAIGLYFSQALLTQTMFVAIIPTFILSAIRYFSYLLCIAKICFDIPVYWLKFKNGEYRTMFTCLLIFLLLSIGCSFLGNDRMPIYLFLLIIAAYNVSFRKITKVYFVLCLLITVSALVCSQFGLIEDYVVIRPSGELRHSFGSTYTTHFAAIVLSLMMTYTYLRGTKIAILEIVGFCAIAVVVYIFCDARLDVACMGLFILAVTVYKMIKKHNSAMSRITARSLSYHKMFRYFTLAFFPVCALLSIGVTLLYGVFPDSLKWLNELLSHRLSLGFTGFSEYGVTLFGNELIEKGNGFSIEPQKIDYYFFIDSSYIKILIRYGIFYFISIITIFSIIMKDATDRRDYILFIILFIVGINSIIAHHLIQLAFSPFILALLASFYAIENSRTKSDSIDAIEVDLLDWKLRRLRSVVPIARSRVERWCKGEFLTTEQGL